MTAAALGRLVMACLKGNPPDAAVSTNPHEVVERGDVAAALAIAWQQTVPRRIADAASADAAAVVLPDGSSFDLAMAERQLAAKEEKRAYLPLRRPMAAARAPFARHRDQRREWRRNLVLDEPSPPFEQLTSIQAFLDSTDELQAVRDLLAALGGVELNDEFSVARGLDLPDQQLFTDVHLANLVKMVRPALPPAAPALMRVSAPRAFAGHVVVDDVEAGTRDRVNTGSVRLWTASTLSAGRFWRLARGAGKALGVCARSDNGGAAAGLAFSLVDEVTRRSSGESRDLCRRGARVMAATAFLQARAAAAAAVVVARRLDVDEEAEVSRDVVRKALGGDPGAEFAAALLLGPLPDGQRVVGAAVGLADEAVAAINVAAWWLFLRDEFDAGFLLRPLVLQGFSELPETLAAPERAWAALLDEFL